MLLLWICWWWKSLLLESSKKWEKSFLETLSLIVNIKERWWARCGRSRKFCQRTLSIFLFFTEYANIIAAQIYYHPPAFQGLCSQTYLPSPAFLLGAPKNRGFVSISFHESTLSTFKTLIFTSTASTYTQHPFHITSTLNKSQILIKSTPFHLTRRKKYVPTNIFPT